MIHAKFQTSMTMLRRVDAFCVILQKKGILRGQMSGNGQFFTAINLCSYFLKVLTEMLLWCKFQVFWTIFG